MNSKKIFLRRQQYVKRILGDRYSNVPIMASATAFKPINIAIIKYWGKRDVVLNLPLVSSISYSFDQHGTKTTLSPNAKFDQVTFNDQGQRMSGSMAKKIIGFLDLFRHPGEFFTVETTNNIPTAAGVASSASGFAAICASLNELRNWQLDTRELSLLSRLGSGSACRSFISGLAFWDKGTDADGLDSCAIPIDGPKMFEMAVIIASSEQKNISSREAMKISLVDPKIRKNWQTMQAKDLELAMRAIRENNFIALGAIVERNSIRLHELLEQSAINYDTGRTRELKKRVVALRQAGCSIFFTQDAGSNLKVIFPAESKDKVQKLFLSQSGLKYFLSS